MRWCRSLSAGVLPAGQKAARGNPCISEQVDGTQSSSDDAIEPAAKGERRDPAGTAHTAAVRNPLQRSRCGIAGRGGLGTRTAERTEGVRAAGGNLRITHLQPETESGL